MRKQTWAAIAVGAVLAVGAGGLGLNAAGALSGTTPAPAVQYQEQPAPTPTLSPAATPTPTPAAAVVDETVETPAPTGPTLCPEGWFANSVDDQGNESNCEQGNDEGQPCVAYDDNNNCTVYYKP